MQSKGKRVLIAGIAGTAVFGAVVASAASLGGLTVGSLGADSAAVSSCDTDGITATWTPTYVTGLPLPRNYGQTSINLAGINNACAGKDIKVALQDASGALLPGGELTSATVTDPTMTLTTAGFVNEEDIFGVAVVIYD